MDPKIKKVLDDMAEFEKQFEAQFAVGEATGLFLYQLVVKHKPKRILELGTWRGASAIYMAVALKELGDGQITTVDVGNDRAEMARQNFIKAGVGEYITQVVSEIDDFILNHKVKYGLVFMDATKSQQIDWLKMILKNNLTDKGVIIIDDVITMGDRMTVLLDFIKNHPDLCSRTENVGDGLMIVEA